MKTFAVVNVINDLKEVSFKLIPTFVHIAQIIIGIFLAIELIKEAIGLAHGDGFHLSKKLITWVLAMIMISAFYYTPPAQTGLACGIYDVARLFGEYSFDEFDVAVNRFIDNSAKDQPTVGIGSIFSPKRLIFAFGFAIAVVIGAVCFLLIYVMICGCYGCLALLIVIGPVTFAFMLNDDFRQITIRWINTIMTNLFMIVIYGVTMQMVAGVLSATLKSAKDSMSSFNLPLMALILLIGPMLAIGLTLQGPKAVQAVMGGAGGGGDVAAGFMGAAMWGAAKGMGKSVWNSTKKAWNKGGKGGGGGGGQNRGSPAAAGSNAGAGGSGESSRGGEPAPGAVQTDSGSGAGSRPSIGERLMPNFIRWSEKGSQKFQDIMKKIGGGRGENPQKESGKEFADGAHPVHEEPGPAGE